jgi:hypothetical protein
MTSKLSCASLSPADQQKVKEIYSQVVGVMSDLAQNPRFVTSYVFEVNTVPAASAADAMPIPLAQVEAEIFAEADGEMAERDKRYVDAQNPEEKLQTQLAMLQKKYNALLKLVGPTQKLMTSNPELFGGEVRGSAPAPGEARGTSSHRPPAIIRLPQVKEEDTERVEKFLKGLVRPFFRYGAVVESRPVEGSTSPLPGLVEVEPSTEGLCMALTEAQYQEMVKAEAEAPIIPDQPTVCGTAGCIDCPATSAAAEPVAEEQPEPLAEPKPTPVCCINCGKPKPNYNHPNWPSPITKRFAKHLAKHSGKTDPKTIKTHQDALEFIAKRANVSVETLLKWTINHYWTVVQGSSHHFHMSTGSATWWC